MLPKVTLVTLSIDADTAEIPTIRILFDKPAPTVYDQPQVKFDPQGVLTVESNVIGG